jgi:hypothetical protein
VYRREVAEIDGELRAETTHLFDELARHGSLAFDWNRVESEVREWLPLRTPPRFMEIRTGSEVRWRSQNLAAPGFLAQPAGTRNVQLNEQGLRLFVTERSGITFAIAADLNQAEEMAWHVLFAMLAGLPFALGFAWLRRALARRARHRANRADDRRNGTRHRRASRPSCTRAGRRG